MEVNVNVMRDASEIVHYDRTGIPLYIQKGELAWYPDKRALCHWHDDIEFISVLEGEMNYYVNGRNVVLKSQDGIMVNTRQMHYGCSIGRKDCTFLCVLVHPALFAANKLIYQTYLLPLLETVSTEFIYLDSSRPDHSFILNSVNQMYTLKLDADPGYELEIIGLFYMIWKRIYRQKETRTNAAIHAAHADAALQKDMVSFIYQHFSEKLTLSEIAASVGVCRSKCCQIFKKYLCQSPIDFLNSYRLEISSQLLTKTDKSITEIALECGFAHSSYYSELFLRYYSCTPREFRRKNSVKS